MILRLRKGKRPSGGPWAAFTPWLVMFAGFWGWPPQKLPPSRLECEKELWASPWGEQDSENSCSPGPSLAGNPFSFSLPAWYLSLAARATLCGDVLSYPAPAGWDTVGRNSRAIWRHLSSFQMAADLSMPLSQTTQGRGPFQREACSL